MNEKELLKRVGRAYDRAARRFQRHLPKVSGSTLAERTADAIALTTRVKIFLDGYNVRLDGYSRDCDQADDWLAGWEMCDRDLRDDPIIGKVEELFWRYDERAVTLSFKLKTRWSPSL